jgi:hypothetical protein
MALRCMNFGIRFEESFIKKFFVSGFVTAIGAAFLWALKSELQNDLQQSSFYFIIFTTLISVSTFAFGLFVLCYRSCIDIDANLKKIRFKKGVFLPFFIENEYDFSDLESLIINKGHEADYDTDSEGKLKAVYSIKIQTLSGDIIGLDTFFDAERALSIAKRISELTNLDIKKQNTTLIIPWGLESFYKRRSRL